MNWTVWNQPRSGSPWTPVDPFPESIFQEVSPLKPRADLTFEDVKAWLEANGFEYSITLRGGQS